MRVMRVAMSCESLRIVASYCDLPSPHFCYYGFIVAIVFCYLLISASVGSPRPSPAPRLPTFFILTTHLQWLFVFSGSWIDESRPHRSWMAIFSSEWECDSPGMHIVYTVYLLITAFHRVAWPRHSGTKASFPLLLPLDCC